MAQSYFEVDPDVRSARTPPSQLYGDPAWHTRILDAVWARAWHYLQGVVLEGDTSSSPNVIPLDVCGEPLILTRGADGAERLLSNVCTHRGATLHDAPCTVRHLRCPYHGRRFHLDGAVAAAPGFDHLEGFPGERDALPSAHLARLGPLRFGSLKAQPEAEAWLGPVWERLPWVPWDELRPQPAGERHHRIAVNWALYVENYLEGLHIPYVHPGLARVLDGPAYRTELLEHGTLQVGVASPGAPCMHPPAGAKDHGTAIGGYYVWLFPGTMINLYPWGVSMNQVEPVGPTDSIVHYRTWVFDPQAPPPDVDTVELQDQQVVARVQAGVRARLYQGGSYSPTEEVGVHHFHRLLAAAL